jgi:hypothetical protein
MIKSYLGITNHAPAIGLLSAFRPLGQFGVSGYVGGGWFAVDCNHMLSLFGPSRGILKKLVNAPSHIVFVHYARCTVGFSLVWIST